MHADAHLAEKLEEFRWSLGPVLPQHVRDRLSPLEQEYFTKYDRLITSYMAATGLDRWNVCFALRFALCALRFTLTHEGCELATERALC
jgi:hypothetical protein